MTGLCGLSALAVSQTPGSASIAEIGIPFIIFGLMLLLGGIALGRRPARD